MSFLKNAFDTIDGGVGAVQDAAGFVGDVVTGDLHGATINAQQFLGNANDFLQGIQGLGANLGSIPKKFAENPLVKLSDSPPIEVAQLAIDAMKLTTGSGAPEDGAEYKRSADLLAEAVDILVDANPAGDRWDGTASQAYEAKNVEHRQFVSDVEVADREIAGIISIEADQVLRTRQTLDDTSQYLYDFGLSTSWMNLVPGGRVAKLVLDGAAAAAGVATAEATMAILVKNALENAARVRGHIDKYSKAAIEDSSGEGSACDPFPVDPEGLGKPPIIPPSRLDPRITYEVPAPEEPIEYGPPATPFGK